MPPVTPFAAVKSVLPWIKIEECIWSGDAATRLGERGDSKAPISRTATIPHRLAMTTITWRVEGLPIFLSIGSIIIHY